MMVNLFHALVMGKVIFLAHKVTIIALPWSLYLVRTQRKLTRNSLIFYL